MDTSTRPPCFTPSFANISRGMLVHSEPKRTSSTSMVPVMTSSSHFASMTGSSMTLSTGTWGPTCSKVMTPEASRAPV